MVSSSELKDLPNSWYCCFYINAVSKCRQCSSFHIFFIQGSGRFSYMMWCEHVGGLLREQAMKPFIVVRSQLGWPQFIWSGETCGDSEGRWGRMGKCHPFFLHKNESMPCSDWSVHRLNHWAINFRLRSELVHKPLHIVPVYRSLSLHAIHLFKETT